MIRSLPVLARALAAAGLSPFLLALAVASGPIRAQCLDYEVFPYVSASLDVGLSDALTWDDGTGPATYLASFASAGGISAVQRWNGLFLEPLGSGLTGRAHTLAAFNGVAGPALYAGGTFTLGGQFGVQVVRWDGSAWSPIAVSGSGSDVVHALRVHDDGGGPALFAGGQFPSGFPLSPGSASGNIARFDGTAWSPLGSGLSGRVNDLEILDEGLGDRLFAGGPMSMPGSPTLLGIARWDGATFSALGAGPVPLEAVEDLTVHDDGSGPALVALGRVHQGSGLYVCGVALWRASMWTSLPTPTWIGANPGAVTVADLGMGPQIVVAGAGAAAIARWTGAAWIPVGSVLRGPCGQGTGYAPEFLESIDFGWGPHLSVSVGGIDLVAPGSFGRILSFDGTEWVVPHLPERGLEPVDTRILAMETFDDGGGPALYVGGSFCHLDGRGAEGFARLRGGVWEPLGFGGIVQGWIAELAVGDLGSGPALYAGGSVHYTGIQQCSGIARWDGSTWRALDYGLSQGLEVASSIVVADLGTGPRLFAGGSFLFAGSVPSPNIASWNGSAWSAMPPGPTAGVNGAVRTLVAHDDGSGAALYLGGSFTAQTLGPSISRIARWNGSSYSTLGSGMNADVWALRAFDDGSGTKLYAAGAFTTAGGVPAQRIARFDGTTWSPVGAGFDALVTCLEVFDDGSGPALYAAGDFMASGATPVTHIARWDGSAWTALGNGVGPAVYALVSHRESAGEPAKLYVGGNLQTAGTLATSNLAAWRGCGGAIDRFCFGDGTSSPCPCGNSGLAFRGCNNSANSLGARLNATGATNPDTIELYVAGETPSAATLVFQGDVLLSNPQPFGDGLRCVSGSLKRLYTRNAMSGALAVPGIGQPSVSTRSAQLGDPLAPGDVRAYQAWYRDVNPSFCAPPDGANWNLSNAVRIVW